MSENNSDNAQTPQNNVQPPAPEETVGQNTQNGKNAQYGQNEFQTVGEEEQPAEEQPAEEQPAEEQPAEEQPAEEQPAEEQPAEEQPAEEAPKAKPEQSLKAKSKIEEEGKERQKLKDAGLEKPTVGMVATLTKLRRTENPEYETAFANAVAGRPLNSYRKPKTERKPRKPKGATVVNTTLKKGKNAANNAGRNNSGNATSFMAPPSQAANIRANSGAANATIKSIEEMGATAMGTIRAMVDATKTLARELAKTNNTSGFERVSTNIVNANTAVSNLFGNTTNVSKKKKKPRSLRKSKKNSAVNVPSIQPLPVILEEGEGENGTVERL